MIVVRFDQILCFSDIDECESMPCQNDAECSDKLNEYHCKCSEEYDGQNCEKSQY